MLAGPIQLQSDAQRARLRQAMMAGREVTVEENTYNQYALSMVRLALLTYLFCYFLWILRPAGNHRI